MTLKSPIWSNFSRSASYIYLTFSSLGMHHKTYATSMSIGLELNELADRAMSDD
jgi:hypothetical protein